MSSGGECPRSGGKSRRADEKNLADSLAGFGKRWNAGRVKGEGMQNGLFRAAFKNWQEEGETGPASRT